MHPLEYTSADMAKIKNKKIELRFQFAPNEFVWISGIITEVYLASNPPNLPGSIDFSVSPESKQILINAKIPIPENIGIFDIEAINEVA